MPMATARTPPAPRCGGPSRRATSAWCPRSRVQPQAGQLGHAVLVALVAQAVADVGGTTVLPHDPAPGRTQGLPVPEQDRLALVGDPDGLQLGGVVLLQDGAGRLEGGLPDLLGRVLDPPRLGKCWANSW